MITPTAWGVTLYTIPVRLSDMLVGCDACECDEDRPVVELMGHALLLRGVCLDVDNISDTIWNKEGRNFDVAMFYAGQVLFLHRKARVECAPLKLVLNI